MAQTEVLKKLDELRTLASQSGVDISGQLQALEAQLATESAKGPAVSTPAWEKVLLARDTQRPKPQHIIAELFTDFIELHGDRRYGDDRAILGGIGRLGGRPVTVIGTRRGNSLQTNMEYNFGMPHPEGYRKAQRLARQAEKFGRPVLFFVDTPGAYPGLQSEERGISEAIATSLFELAGLRVPVISTITGEGGSGGALALAVADRILMMENAVLSVISPEGCASILFKDSSRAPEAAQALGIEGHKLRELGLIDTVIPEGPGLHKNSAEGLTALRQQLERDLDHLCGLEPGELLQRRSARLRQVGRYLE